MGQLEGRTALVTGGTRGIGRATVEAYLAEGAKVALNGRSADKGELALKEMDAGDSVIFLQGDVTNQQSLESVVDRAVEHFGRVDILVNNAGGAADNANVVDHTDEAWMNTITWNLHSTFWATRRMLKYMIPQEYGRIINLSSVEGKVGKPGISAYVTAKHAIVGFTKSVAREVGTSGITVNAVCPGMIPSDIFWEQGPTAAEAMGVTVDELLDMFVKESAIQRHNTFEEVAAVNVLLASEVAGGITGSMYNVDGGTSPY
jgi:3-hydroxybutyrate dehydrogenase